jgi:protein-tyrosine phosphatase
MEIITLDKQGRLFLSPDIDDWQPIKKHKITTIIDLDADLDIGVPTIPNHILYVYFPIQDGKIPDEEKLHSVAGLGSTLIQNGHRVLSHCGLGLNRSALVAGVILVNLGMRGKDAVTLLRQKRPGALFNPKFASYLHSL